MSFASPTRVSRPAGASLEETWNTACRELDYSAELKAAGWELLQKLDKQDALGERDTQTKYHGQVAAVAYLASSRGKQFPGINVLQLTEHFSMDVKSFFAHVVENHSCLYAGVELKEITTVKGAYLVSTIMFAKWKDFQRTLFPMGFAGTTADSPEANVKLAFDLGWLLYALAKCHMTTGATDALSAYHLFAEVIHLLLALIPEEAQTSTAFWTKLSEPIGGSTYPLPQHAQKVLWEQIKAVPNEVAKQRPTMVALLDELGAIFSLGELHKNGELTPDGSSKLRAQLAPGTLSRTVEAVRARYSALWQERSQLDDAFYLKPQAVLATTRVMQSPATSPARHTAHASANSQTGERTPAGLLTPLRQPNPMGSRAPQTVPQTPMSSQLESVGWLQKAVDEAGVAEAEKKLEKYYKACDTDLKEAIQARVQRLCEQVQSALLVSDGDRFSEPVVLGQRLYYKMLLCFLEAEERRLKQTNFSALLTNDSFHTSLLACCLESVFASYSTAGMVFPAILRTLDLQPFDFGKVIESFIKHEPHLPAHLKKHFADVEARIIEQLVWQEESPLHKLMHEYDLSLAADAAEAAEPGSLKEQQRNAGSKRARAALEQFMRKCLYLAAKRIQDLCLRLLLPEKLTQQVWDVVKLILDKARHLLEGRHLDQLLMCSIYGVCKVNLQHGAKQVTFRDIINQYKRQQGATARTFREVKMRSSADPPQDIIQFYNLVFIPAMKDHLLRVAAAPAAAGGAQAARTEPQGAATAGVSGAAGAAAASGAGAGSSTHISPDISAARGGASPRHVSAGVYVSAPSDTPNAPFTPRTRLLLCDTPGGAADANHKLKNINSQINAPAGNDVAAQALSSMSGAGTNGAPPPSVANGHPNERRGELDLSGGGAGGMAAGLKRRLEPSRSSTPGGSSADGESAESASVRSRSS